MQAQLPTAMTRALLSDSVTDNHRNLARVLGAINQGWEAVDQFSQQMGTFGTFDLAAPPAIAQK